MKGNPEPVEALNTVHSCQNRDTLQQWSIDHNITDSLIDLEMPEWVLEDGIKEDPTGNEGSQPLLQDVNNVEQSVVARAWHMHCGGVHSARWF